MNPSPKYGGIQAQVKLVELPDTLEHVALTSQGLESHGSGPGPATKQFSKET